MPLTFDHWRRALEAQPGHLPDDVVRLVLECFESYLRGAGKGVTLDQAFGASGPSGKDPWFVELGRERRDCALGKLGAVLRPGGSVSEKAEAVQRAARRYEPTWNRRDQFRAAPAPGDAERYWLFMARREGVIPDSIDRLRKIISRQDIESNKEPLVFKTSV
jgi:hypothetical protein